MPDFKGVVQIQTAAGDPTIVLDGDNGDVSAGGSGRDGQIVVRTAAELTRISLDAATGSVIISALDGDPLVSIDGQEGDVTVYRKVSGVNRAVLQFDASDARLTLGASGVEGDLVVQDGSGRNVFQFDAASAALYLGAEGNEGDLIVRDGSGRMVFRFDANTSSCYIGADGNAGDLYLRDASNRTAFRVSASSAGLGLGTTSNAGEIVVRDANNRAAIQLNGSNAALYVGTTDNEGDIIVRDAANRDVFHFDAANAVLYIGASGNEGDIIVRDSSNREVFHFDAGNAALYVGAAGNEGDVIVRNNNGNETIRLDGNSGDIILSNADAAEQFDLAAHVEASPGSVVVLTDEGTLVPSSKPYDKRVVGVIAGAGAFRPGIVMDYRESSEGRSRVAVSVMGKVTCRADASYGRITVGDLLTTSPKAGCAMRVADPAKAFGAVIGKALSPLAEGMGLVDVLVGLQ
jgi:hypothetical protein